MAHFAEVDENNIVLRVIVVNNNELLDENGIEQEQKGIDFCVNLFGGKWVQTSYNGNFRKMYAGIGFTFNLEKNIFIPPQPYPSWIFDDVSENWVSPIPYPELNDDKIMYVWNEQNLQWVVSQIT